MNSQASAYRLTWATSSVHSVPIQRGSAPVERFEFADPRRKGWRPSRRGGARDLVPAGPRGPWARRIVCPGGGLVPRSLDHRSFARSKTSRWFGDRVLHGRWTPSAFWRTYERQGLAHL